MQSWETIKKTHNDEPYYDLIDDWDLIASSFLSEYGIRLSKDLHGMHWSEFRALLSGLSAESALRRIVEIRAETDRDRMKHWTKSMKAENIRWKMKRAHRKTQDDTNAFLNEIKTALISRAGISQERRVDNGK